MNIVIADHRNWHKNLARNVEARTAQQVYCFNRPEQVTAKELRRVHAEILFLPFWSWRVPDEVYRGFEVVIFHMTDLPFGKGGSPLQNLIARGIYETKISAIRCVTELDSGPIYIKRPLTLHGSAEEIFMRAGHIIEDMIVNIISESPVPVPQQGEAVTFRRRNPEEGNITELESLDRVFDWIRMLDAEGYRKAFLEFGKFRLEFERATLRRDCVKAEVTIKVKTND